MPAYRILIVDDNGGHRQLLRCALQPLGLELHEAIDVSTALASWETWRPDLIWLDIQLDNLERLAAVSTIRRVESASNGPRTRILALTTSSAVEDREEILAAGCDDVVLKPFRRNHIFAKMAEHLGLKDMPVHTKESVPVEPDDPAPWVGRARALVVDDNVVGQMVAARLLQKLGVEVDVVANGEDALWSLRAQPYDLVLMDIRMPGIDGFAAARQIAAEWGSARPVVVAMSAAGTVEAAAHPAGIDGWLEKPLRHDELRHTLEQWLDQAWVWKTGQSRNS